MRSKEESQFIQNLKRRNHSLEKEKDVYYREMIKRGKEVTKMIRIFLICEDLLPEEKRKEFRNIALEFAARQDNDRGSCYCKDVIDFRGEAIHLELGKDLIGRTQAKT